MKSKQGFGCINFRATFETTDDRLTFLINIPVHPGCDNNLHQLDTQGQVSVTEGTQKTTEQSTQETTSPAGSDQTKAGIGKSLMTRIQTNNEGA